MISPICWHNAWVVAEKSIWTDSRGTLYLLAFAYTLVYANQICRSYMLIFASFDKYSENMGHNSRI